MHTLVGFHLEISTDIALPQPYRQQAPVTKNSTKSDVCSHSYLGAPETSSRAYGRNLWLVNYCKLGFSFSIRRIAIMDVSIGYNPVISYRHRDIMGLLEDFIRVHDIIGGALSPLLRAEIPDPNSAD